MLTAARESPNHNDFALVAMLGLLGLRIFEATGADVTDLGEERGHRVLRVVGKGTKLVLVPLPPAVGRAIDRAVEDRTAGPILLNGRGVRMDRHAATRRLRHLADAAGVRLPAMHPHMLRHTFVTTMQMSRVAFEASFDRLRERYAIGDLGFQPRTGATRQCRNGPGQAACDWPSLQAMPRCGSQP